MCEEINNGVRSWKREKDTEFDLKIGIYVCIYIYLSVRLYR